MKKITEGTIEASEIDDALKDWRQGDIALGANWFVHIADADKALSDIQIEESIGVNAVTTEVAGVVLISQSCDILRHCLERPFLQVAPLVELSESDLDAVKRRRRPRFAYLSAVADRRLVVDLDRVMTVEKSIVATWTRLDGCKTDAERSSFAEAIGRHKNRPALPNAFGPFVQKLVKRLSEKRDKQSAEGEAVRALVEVRVTASPDWTAGDVTVFFWFVVSEPVPEIDWATIKDTWLKYITPTATLLKCEGRIVTLKDMTAEEYSQSSVWDLERVSPSDE